MLSPFLRGFFKPFSCVNFLREFLANFLCEFPACKSRLIANGFPRPPCVFSERESIIQINSRHFLAQ
jgi:hypothetical protein